MRESITVTGIVIKCTQIGEYDKRVVMLTKEMGKISFFARGAKRANSRFIANTQPFCFGKYSLFVSGKSYQLMDVSVDNYFDELKNEIEWAYLGMYFLEIVDYYSRENNDEYEMLKLLYQSLRVISNKLVDNDLVRMVFEIKAIMINGEYPGLPRDRVFAASTEYTMNYIYDSSIEKLYSFKVSDEVFNELRYITGFLAKTCYDRRFNSLDILETLK